MHKFITGILCILVFLLLLSSMFTEGYIIELSQKLDKTKLFQKLDKIEETFNKEKVIIEEYPTHTHYYNGPPRSNVK